MQDKTEQALTDIQGLQNIEQDLFNQINDKLTAEQRNNIIMKINEISQMRINLYKNMNNIGVFFGENVASSNAALAEQTVAIGIVEQELNTAKQRLTELQDNSNQNMRMVQINTYYGDKYNNISDILKSLILFCIPIIFFTLLYQTEILPKGVYNVILIVLIIWAVISVGGKLFDAAFRDRMNYQEYAWVFNKDSAPPNNTSYNPQTTNNPWSSSANIVCLGQNCCYDGTTYISSLNQCVPNDVATSMTTSDATTTSSDDTTTADSSSSSFKNGAHSRNFQLPQSGFGGL
jgi:hypothetical protein